MASARRAGPGADARVLDPTILLFLVQDGVTNGAIYALLAVALVLAFAVTRVILLPQGEFVTFGALSLAALEAGRIPGTAALLVAMGFAAAVLTLWRARAALTPALWLRTGLGDVAAPLALYALARALAPLKLGVLPDVLLTLALIVPMGPLIYRIAFKPLAEASVLVLLIASVGVDLALTGLGLVFFGPEGYRTTPVFSQSFALGPMIFSAQSLIVFAMTAALMLALYLFFGRTLAGKALQASAVNRTGARLVGISTAFSGRAALAICAFIGALSGILIVPATTIYFDSGFIIGLKGFVAAILGGLGSYPLAVAAALFVGIVESFSSFEASAFKEVIVFTVIIPVLLWRSARGGVLEDES